MFSCEFRDISKDTFSKEHLEMMIFGKVKEISNRLLSILTHSEDQNATFELHTLIPAGD